LRLPHPLRQVEEPALKHVGGVEPALEPRVQAQSDRSSQAIAVPLEQVGQCPSIAGSELLDHVDGLAWWISDDLANTS